MASPTLPTSPPLHLFFFPLMAPGHIIPMTNMAVLLSRHGVRSTVVTTPANANLVRSQIAGHPVDLLLLQFPSAEAGLLEGQENLTYVTSKEMSMRFFMSLDTLREPFQSLVYGHHPDCVVSDMFLPWTADVAEALGVPRIVFHGMGFFPLCLLNRVGRGDIVDNDTVVIPNLPHRIEMKRSQLPESVFTTTEFSVFMGRIMESEKKSYGEVVNSFYELEADYVDHFRNNLGKKAWHLGPITPPPLPLTTVGDDSRDWFPWLNSQRAKSVVYVSFGSLCRFTQSQLHELELGLESSEHPYLWVVRDNAADGKRRRQIRINDEKKERIGVVLHGWAPQVGLLNHESVGGFVTHCGWNSVMEAVVAGVPMVTWPLFSEQFYNEKLVVDLLGVGVAVGADEWGMREEEKRVVKGEEVARAVRCTMDGGDEATDRRRRVEELKETARRAVMDGGTSDVDVGKLIKELMLIKMGKGE